MPVLTIPRVFLRRLGQHKIDAAASDPILLAEYRQVLSNYDTYLEQQPTTCIDEYLDPDTDLVAYFSAEYGFHESLPIYAGGLGILAADYCKAMSNLWVPFVGVGILYHEGYFRQRIDCHGVQIAERLRSDSSDMPVSRHWMQTAARSAYRLNYRGDRSSSRSGRSRSAISVSTCWTVTSPPINPRTAS